ncbi:hypothetical protein Bca52824_027895, partial [Brassica carinata]
HLVSKLSLLHGISSRSSLFSIASRARSSLFSISSRARSSLFSIASRPNPSLPFLVERQTQPATQTHSGSSRAKRRRKELVEACDKQTDALVVKNRIAEWMLQREEASSVENVLEILDALPGVREWSAFYE